jgi:murein DD-endopeptidase MepM/ murein hydrolase activator NlpD
MAIKKKAKFGRPIIRAAVLMSIVVLGASVHWVTQRLEAYSRSPYPLVRALEFGHGLVASSLWAARPDHELAASELPVEFSFRRGETLSDVVGDLGLDSDEAHTLVSEIVRHVDVRRIRPVDRYAVMVNHDSELQGLRLTLDGKGYLHVSRGDAVWRGTWHPFVEETKVHMVKGYLEGALETSIRRAGGEIVLAYEMAEVLQWDLDFNRDLRLGDTFEVMYERLFLDGEFSKVGEVLALVYINDGRHLEAYRFGNDGGHYDAEGKPLRKLFLRSPLRYSRVTSGFSSRRFHPVLKRYRPHYGVDYGAPTGTPVRVTGSGTVRFAGWSGGGGKTVKVRHPNGYVTAYLHLSRYASGIRPGRRVRQGDVIGFVGSTGLATGPHLDYRIQRDGKWINPLNLDNKPAEPISAEQMPEYVAWRDQLRQAFNAGEPIEAPRLFETAAIATLSKGRESASDSTGR